MARRTYRKPKISPDRSFDWKNHPVIVASGSAAATFLLCLAVFTQLIAPTQNAKLEIELLKLKDAKTKIDQSYSSGLRANKALKAESTRLADEIKALEESANVLRQELIDSRAGNLFTPGSPYPNGHGLARIGMTVGDIKKIYAGHKVEIDQDDPDTVTVYLTNSPFDRVTFHLTDKTDRATISHLSFDMPFFGSKYSDDFLHNRLVETFGSPSSDSTSKDFMWKVGASYSLFAHNKSGYVIMRRGAEPVFWALR